MIFYLLKWNKYTTTTQAGIEPSNGDTTLTESFINGPTHYCRQSAIYCPIPSALSYLHDAGTEITTETSRATLTYRKAHDENEMTVYIKGVNGFFLPAKFLLTEF